MSRAGRGRWPRPLAKGGRTGPVVRPWEAIAWAVLFAPAAAWFFGLGPPGTNRYLAAFLALIIAAAVAIGCQTASRGRTAPPWLRIALGAGVAAFLLVMGIYL